MRLHIFIEGKKKANLSKLCRHCVGVNGSSQAHVWVPGCLLFGSRTDDSSSGLTSSSLGVNPVFQISHLAKGPRHRKVGSH